MTGQEILFKLKELGISGKHLHGYSLKLPNDKYLEVLEEYRKDPSFKYEGPCYVARYLFGSINEIEQVGGEGEGDYYHVVWFFENHDIYLMETAFHDSWNGIDWNNDLHEVKPVQKTITVYE